VIIVHTRAFSALTLLVDQPVKSCWLTRGSSQSLGKYWQQNQYN